MSARTSLRDRVDRARRENFIDLRVPTPAFDGLFVRCRALTSTDLNSIVDRHQGKPDAGVQMAIDALVASCLGVWEESDGKGVSPVDGFSGVIDLDTLALSGDLPTFSSPELAEALGVDEASAGAAVRALLATSSDLPLMTLSDALEEFSTRSNENVVRTTRGN